jgi:hypothetical protein
VPTSNKLGTANRNLHEILYYKLSLKFIEIFQLGLNMYKNNKNFTKTYARFCIQKARETAWGIPNQTRRSTRPPKRSLAPDTCDVTDDIRKGKAMF